MNAYLYVGNNPVNVTDPYGLAPGWVDRVHDGLGVLGLAPGVGIFADFGALAISIARLDGTGALIDLGSMVPIGGGFVRGGELAYKTGKAALKKSAGQLGREGEAMASAITGASKNTQSYNINGRNRIPDQVISSDLMTRMPNHVVEVKNVKKQALTQQLRDDIDLVGPGGKVEIFVRPDTKISRPLQQAHDNPRNPILIRREL